MEADFRGGFELWIRNFSKIHWESYYRKVIFWIVKTRNRQELGRSAGAKRLSARAWRVSAGAKCLAARAWTVSAGAKYLSARAWRFSTVRSKVSPADSSFQMKGIASRAESPSRRVTSRAPPKSFSASICKKNQS